LAILPPAESISSPFFGFAENYCACPSGRIHAFCLSRSLDYSPFCCGKADTQDVRLALGFGLLWSSRVFAHNPHYLSYFGRVKIFMGLL